MNIRYLFLLGLFIFPVCLFSEDNAAAFIERAHSPRVIAMGHAFSGLADDGSSLYLNPAGLSLSSTFSFQVMSYTAFETDYSNIMMNIRLRKFTLGLGVINAKVSDIQEVVENPFLRGFYQTTGKVFDYGARATYLGLSFKPFQAMSFGAAVKAIREELASYGVGEGVGVDLGVLFDFKFQRFGLSVLNVAPTPIKWEDLEEKMPRIITLGTSTHLFKDRLILTAEGEFKNDRDVVSCVGTEWWIIPVVAVRAGVDDGQLSLGTGLKLLRLKLNMSYTQLDDFMDDTFYRVEIGYDFRSKRHQKKELNRESKQESLYEEYPYVDNSIPDLEATYFPSPTFKVNLEQTTFITKKQDTFLFNGEGTHIKHLYIDNVVVPIDEINAFRYLKKLPEGDRFVVKFRIIGQNGSQETITRFFIRQ